MKSDDKAKPDTDMSDKGPERSRRKVLAGVGALAAGTALAATAPAEASGARDKIGAGAAGATVGEFIARIAQSGVQGEEFTAVGYLTKLAGTHVDDLFSEEPHDVSTALATLFATGSLQARVMEGQLRVIDVVGELKIYQRSTPGASFDDIASFQIGTQAGRFALTLQDVLAIFAPGQGIPTLSGEMSQMHKRPIGTLGKVLHYRGKRIRISATGIASRPDPASFNTSAEMAGNWILV